MGGEILILTEQHCGLQPAQGENIELSERAKKEASGKWLGPGMETNFKSFAKIQNPR